MNYTKLKQEYERTQEEIRQEELNELYFNEMESIGIEVLKWFK